MNEESIGKKPITSETIKKEADSRKEEIKVGLRNALDRNESLEKAKQSLVNAGYNTQTIEEASEDLDSENINIETRRIERGISPRERRKMKNKKIKIEKIKKVKQVKEKPVNNKIPTKKKEGTDTKRLPKNAEAKPHKKKTAIYVVISIIILVLAAMLGLYWDKIVGLF
jgi:hypothetical protein